MSNPTTSGDAAAFAIPLLPGKTDIDRREMRSCWQGDRRAAYEASRKRLGFRARIRAKHPDSHDPLVPAAELHLALGACGHGY
jgi:hypothetical protein